MITYTINSVPVARMSYDGASEAATVTSEVFARLIEMDEIKLNSGADLCRRLATLADLSPYAFKLATELGSGQTAGVMESYERLAKQRGITRQAMHWQFGQEVKRIGFVFPELAALLSEYREMSEHHEDKMSSADQLRSISDGLA